MEDKVKKIQEEVESFIVSSKEELEKFRISFLGSKGSVKGLFADLKNVANEQKREAGQLVNGLREFVQNKFDTLKDELESSSSTDQKIDTSRPGDPIKLGARHPLSLVRSEIIEIFSRIGFTVSEGPEIEDDWHNFSALNFPEEHPARDMQDTFQSMQCLQELPPIHVNNLTNGNALHRTFHSCDSLRSVTFGTSTLFLPSG